MRQGLDVLCISMEMDGWTVQNRIHANLFDTMLDGLETLSKAAYTAKHDSLNAMNVGRLVAHDWPTGAAHTGHFRSYLAELKAKKNFIPVVIVVDYLNICSSERVQVGGNVPQYVMIGSIAKELRALAQQTDTVL